MSRLPEHATWPCLCIVKVEGQEKEKPYSHRGHKNDRCLCYVCLDCAKHPHIGTYAHTHRHEGIYLCGAVPSSLIAYQHVGFPWHQCLADLGAGVKKLAHTRQPLSLIKSTEIFIIRPERVKLPKPNQATLKALMVKLYSKQMKQTWRG